MNISNTHSIHTLESIVDALPPVMVAGSGIAPITVGSSSNYVTTTSNHVTPPSALPHVSDEYKNLMSSWQTPVARILGDDHPFRKCMCMVFVVSSAPFVTLKLMLLSPASYNNS